MSSPTDLSGLQRYYRANDQAGADGSTLSTWTDSSGNGVDATASGGASILHTNVRGGKKAVHFDGTGQFDLTGVTSNTTTVFAVFRVNSEGVPAVITGSDGNNYIGTYPSAGLPDLIITASTAQDYFRGFTVGLWFFMVWTHNAATSSICYRNGGPSVQQTAGITTQTFTFDNIGGFSVYRADCDIAEIGCYDRALSSGEVAGLMSGWLAYYGLGDLVICDGNSLTRGRGTSDPPTQGYPAQLAALIGGNVDVLNFGVDSQTTTQMIANAPTKVDPLFESLRPHNIVVAWECTNDAFQDGADAATVLADIRSYCSARTTVGFEVINLTYLPRVGSSGGFETDRVTVNGDINNVSNVPTNWAGVADVASDTRIANPYNTLLNTVDGTHLNQTGYGYVADDVHTEYQALFGGTIDSVTIDQGNQTLYGGQIVDFTATVVGSASDHSVTWTADSGTINATTGEFIAPGGEFSGSQHIMVTATSVVDGTKSNTITVTVPRHAPGSSARMLHSSTRGSVAR